jgi:hypothetical protein
VRLFFLFREAQFRNSPTLTTLFKFIFHLSVSLQTPDLHSVILKAGSFQASFSR